MGWRRRGKSETFDLSVCLKGIHILDLGCNPGNLRIGTENRAIRNGEIASNKTKTGALDGAPEFYKVSEARRAGVRI